MFQPKTTSFQKNSNPSKERIYSVPVSYLKEGSNIILKPYMFERGCDGNNVTIVCDGNGNQKPMIPSNISPTVENGFIRAKVGVRQGDLVINAVITEDNETKIFITRITDINISTLDSQPKANIKTKLLAKWSKNFETNKYSWFCSKRTIDPQFANAIIAAVAALEANQLNVPIFVIDNQGLMLTPCSQGVITKETEDNLYNRYIQPFLSKEEDFIEEDTNSSVIKNY
jgi:hypothetical protein